MYDTRAAILWDDDNLYLAFVAEEPFVSAALTERDSIIFQENDLEVFIDGGDCYYELEVNAANTVYEVFFIWRDAYTRGSRFDQAQFDVHSPAAFTFGGDYDRTPATFWTGSHPRGTRWAFTDFDMPGLRTAVQVDGTLNDDSDIDSGWSLEIAIPWSSLALLADGRTVPPQHGDEWRLFLGRFQRLEVSGMVRRKMRLKLIVHLVRKETMEREFERLPYEPLYDDILGIPVRKAVITVDAGRNLAVLVEAAVRNTILQLRGIDTYQEFIERHQRAMQQPDN